MLQFAEQFNDSSIVVTLSRQLSWSHFLVLIPVKSSEAKLFYARAIAEQALSVRDLRKQLASKTFELGTQIEQIASRFKLRVHELTEAARAGANVAKSVTEKIERAEMALLELEDLIAEKDVTVTSEFKDYSSVNEGSPSRSLAQEINQAEVAVSELEHIVKQQDSSQYLIQKIQEALKHKKG